MTFQKRDAETLAAIGLTSTQAKVFLTLASLGKAKARTIWKNSGVARQDIYRILTELQEKGLAEKIIATPIEYTVLPIQDALAILLRRKAQEYEEIEKKANKLLIGFKKSQQEKTTTNEYEITRVTAKKVNLYRLDTTLKSAQKSLDIIDSWASFKHAVVIYADFHMKAAKRNITRRFITDEPENGEIVPKIVQVLKKDSFFKLRHIPTRPLTSIVIADQKQIGICTEKTRYSPESPSLFSDNPCLVAILQDYFELLWSKATEDNT